MPLVTVTHWVPLSDQVVANLREEIPASVANHLTVGKVKEAWLTPDDIEVFFDSRTTQKHAARDVRSVDVAIRVEAMYFKERERKVNKRTERISEDLDQTLEGLKYSVWVVLPVAGYCENLRSS